MIEKTIGGRFPEIFISLLNKLAVPELDLECLSSQCLTTEVCPKPKNMINSSCHIRSEQYYNCYTLNEQLFSLAHPE